ncbi:MAG: diguanylate cyclase [Pseudomonadota bacterium]|nr:diguanylate cyclase [Pseudomonadota bacterium]MDP1903553.1 diguanylate cyclase [Pseudomonadota bacterium]MDP2351410.1 diguanylate cyclase [Pseudomonadota bacterium]
MISSDDIFAASILIVDDQEANVLLLVEMLGDAGYRCIASTMDPQAVCELHRAHHYDLIVLDLQMPGLDGFQVMEGLKEIEADAYLPVLVMTAEPDLKLRALAAGAKDFISKPFDLMEARMRIHNLLEVRLLYQQLEDYSRALESLALHDSLTGLPNRRLLFDRLELSIAHAHRNKSTMAVMYLDLDGFKQINDTLGHDAGDALLRMVAARLEAAVRQEDTVARMGGDEFVIGLWEISHADAVARLASKVIQAVSQPYRMQERSVSVTASVGVGIYPQHGEDVETLLKRADLALHEAKRSGKNDYRIAAHGDLSAMARG